MELFRKMKEEERMYGALREIMKDDLLREREEGRKEERKESLRKQEEIRTEMQKEMQKESLRIQQEMRQGTFNTVAERMISAGKPGSEISLFTDLGRQDIDKIARKMNRTVYWNEGRA